MQDVPTGNGPFTEVPFAATTYGYGGRVDYWSGPMNGKLGKDPKLVSVAISSVDPGHIEMKVWDEGEAKKAWHVFSCALQVWRIKKKYDPRAANCPF